MVKSASSVVLLMVVLIASFSMRAWAQMPQPKLTPDTGMVSLDFQDADIKNVLKVLAFKSGVNIVAAPDVTGVVNIELKDVPWEKALEVILSTYGYGYDRKGNIITVMSIENLKKFREDSLSLEAQEPLVSKAFSLSFAKASDAEKIIEKLISKRGFINFDERTNTIIVRDLSNNLELISGVVKSLDAVTPQVLIEVKVVETKLDNKEHLGIDWNATLSITGASRPTTLPFISAGGILGHGGNGSFIPALTSFSNPVAAPTATNFTYGTINASQFSSILDMLSNRDDTKNLANPKIVTLDNQKATINIGEQYPVPNYSFNAQTGSVQVIGFNPIPIGVILDVTPHVNNAGLVTLDVHPTVSTLNGTITSNSVSYPDVLSRHVDTNVMVEDGKTLVIGGLIQTSTDVVTIKIPLLGDLPVVGNFFKTTQTHRQRDEVILFLTPHIITVGKSSASDTIQ